MPNDYGDIKIIHRLKFYDLVKLSFRVFRTKLMRTLLTIFGMAIGIGTVLFLVSLGYGLQYILIGKLVSSEDSLITLEAFYSTENALNVEQSDVDAITRLPETGEVSPVGEFPGEIRVGDTSGLIFADVVKDNYFRLSGIKPDIGTVFTANNPGVVATSPALKLMNFPADGSSLGKQLQLKIYYQSEDGTTVEEVTSTQPAKIVGIIKDDTGLQKLIVPDSMLDRKPPFFKSVLVKAKNIDVVEQLRNKLLDKGFLISAKIDLVNQARKVMSGITVTLGVFGITALFVAAIGMFNTMIVGFLERIYEVGIMKSLGATDRDIRNLFLMESSMLGFLGGVGGILLGVGLGDLANFGLAILARRLGGQPVELFITPAWFLAVIIGGSVIIGLIAGFWPARKATFLSPKEAFIRK